MNWPVFFTRLGSAIIFAIIMMLGLLYSHPMAIFILALLIQFLCIREFFGLVGKIFPDQHFPGWLMWFTQVAGVLVVLSVPMLITTPGYAFILMLCPILILLCTILDKKTALVAGFAAITGLLYIALPMAFLVTLRGINWVIPLALILMIWMNDTMAYIVGSFIGKTPFSPISPKKTWEGTAGGALLTIAGAAVWGYYAPFKQYDMTDWMVLALCAAVAGTAGDLLESKLKRLAGIKDSGNIMPGHGGALDRFDSLLVTLPFAFCYAVLFMIN
ncbi:phosphatidate cytidylyltransferase [Taibaiella koreensis]|uniref:phosphatidate cytidylyltransferase n=1 Tax=Taibaiella koreensis TaxID=1268548 RepID=UPI000E59BF43|nr:phosphatidate cytidylyltransferase [Taibaiella koreensis]